MVTFRNGERNIVNVMKERGWKYFVLAFIDVQANYLIVYAYQFTNIASIQVCTAQLAAHKEKHESGFSFQ
jgi:hypothetical protein